MDMPSVSTSWYHFHSAPTTSVGLSMASIFQTFPLLRRAAPRLSREFFTCSTRCLKKPQTPGLHASKPIRQGLFLKTFRSQHRSVTSAGTSSITPEGLSSLQSLSKSIGGVKKANIFPDVSDKVVAYWLLGSAASVFGIVVFGGLTRLTESGYHFYIRLPLRPCSDRLSV